MYKCVVTNSNSVMFSFVWSRVEHTRNHEVTQTQAVGYNTGETLSSVVTTISVHVSLGLVFPFPFRGNLGQFYKCFIYFFIKTKQTNQNLPPIFYPTKLLGHFKV